MHSIEDAPNTIPTAALRPTQATVGFRDVARKRAGWREHSRVHGARFLRRHWIPTVLGPRREHYAIDHHHLARALHEEGLADIPIRVVADLSLLSPSAFWRFLDSQSWCHPHDQNGKRLSMAGMPKTIADLADDPYRSLAGALRRAGGYAKNPVPFSEFVWADFLRRRIEPLAVRDDFEGALREAIRLAHGDDPTAPRGSGPPRPSRSRTAAYVGV